VLTLIDARHGSCPPFDEDAAHCRNNSRCESSEDADARDPELKPPLAFLGAVVCGDPKLDLRMRPTDRMVARPSQTIGRAHGALSPHGSNLVFFCADVLLNLRHHRRSVLGLDLLSFPQQGVPSVPDEVGPLLQLLLARVEDSTLARTGAANLCSDALNPKRVLDVSLSKLGLDTGSGDSIEVLRKHERFHRRRRVVPRGLRRSRRVVNREAMSVPAAGTKRARTSTSQHVSKPQAAEKR
jgi:hypothetical protein